MDNKPQPLEMQDAASEKPRWTSPEPRFYDVDAVRASNGTTGDNSGNSAASLS